MTNEIFTKDGQNVAFKGAVPMGQPVTAVIKALNSGVFSKKAFYRESLCDDKKLKEQYTTLEKQINSRRKATLGTMIEVKVNMDLLPTQNDLIHRYYSFINRLTMMTSLNFPKDGSEKEQCAFLGYAITIYRSGMLETYDEFKSHLTDVEYDYITVSAEIFSQALKKHHVLLDAPQTFEGGYGKITAKGDLDFLSKDSIIDLKTGKNVSGKDMLQQVFYFVLGMRSIYRPLYEGIQKVSLFHLPSFTIYSLDIDEIPNSFLKRINRFI